MRTPEFWQDERSLLGRLLTPVGELYGAATQWRVSRGTPYRAAVPVICIGNATAGGSGKTPTVQALARAALTRGIAVHILSRGYGGTLEGPQLVDPAKHSARDVGDEPLLLAAVAPTWIGRDRAASAQSAVIAGAQLLIMDDGLQNPSLAKDFSLLVIDGGFGFGNGRLIPAGPLREPVAAAAGRVQGALLIGNDATGVLPRLPPALPVFTAAIRSVAADLAGRKYVAFAGLGRPQKFRDTLAETGATIQGWFPFADHHVYTVADMEMLAKAAQKTNARLITTEKDFVRVPMEFRQQVDGLPIVLVPGEPALFDGILDRVMP